MSTRTFTLNFVAPGMLTLPQGRFFMIKNAASALNISARRRDGQPVEFVSVGAGLQYNALESVGWYSLEVTSATVQVVEIVISDESSVTFANAVSVAGITQTQEQPFATFAPPIDVNIGPASNLDIPANPARRAIVIGSRASNAPVDTNLRVRDQTGTAGAGPELQPGTSIRIATTAALRVRNGDANAQGAWYYEEV